MGRPRKDPNTTYRGKRKIRAEEKEVEKKRKLEKKIERERCGSKESVLVQTMRLDHSLRSEESMED